MTIADSVNWLDFKADPVRHIYRRLGNIEGALLHALTPPMVDGRAERERIRKARVNRALTEVRELLDTIRPTLSEP